MHYLTLHSTQDPIQLIFNSFITADARISYYSFSRRRKGLKALYLARILKGKSFLFNRRNFFYQFVRKIVHYLRPTTHDQNVCRKINLMWD